MKKMQAKKKHRVILAFYQLMGCSIDTVFTMACYRYEIFLPCL